MFNRVWILVMILCSSLGASAADLSTAPSEDLLKLYAQLRALQGSTQGGITENAVFRQDAATFTFEEGHLTLAEPVGGRVLAACFDGQGSVQIQAPSPALQHQLARFAGGPVLKDEFTRAVFFFTDDSLNQLKQSVNFRDGADADAATKAFAAEQKKFSGSFNGWWVNERDGNFEMRNISARMLADMTDASSKGFFLADFKGLRHGDMIYQVSWNRDSLPLPYFANDEEVMLLHYNRDDYFEWVAGFHLAEEYAQSAWPEHRTLIAHCRAETIEADIGKDSHLSATASMQIEVPGGPARVLPLSLDGVLRISSILDEQGKKISFIQEPREMDSDTWIILPEPATPGKVYNLKIAYTEDSTRESRIVHPRGPGLFYVTARENWFPSFGAFDDRTQYKLHFDSPKRFVFLGTGRLVNSSKGKDALTTEWDSEVPLSVVGFNYGDFESKSQSEGNLTVTAYGGKEVPDELIPAQHSPMGAGVNTTAMLGYAAGMSLQAFRLYQYYFGPLPFKDISVTEQPVMGYGQSWPTLIFLPYDSLLDSTTRHFLGFQVSAQEAEFYNVVAVHEMAHQWWGHLVGWKTYRDQWLSEGFAEFSASLYVRKANTEKIRSYWDLKRTFLLSKNPAGHRPVDVGPLYLNGQLNSKLEPVNSFMIYAKGAYVLEMIRMIMENPRQPEPDQRFIDMMHDFVTTYSYRNASTADFQHIVEKHIGAPMDWFFNEYVYGTQIPTYNFKYDLKPAPDGKWILQGSLTQSGVSNDFQMYVPFYLVMGKAVHRMGLIRITGSSTVPLEIPLSARPDRISIDEYHDILAIER